MLVIILLITPFIHFYAMQTMMAFSDPFGSFAQSNLL